MGQCKGYLGCLSPAQQFPSASRGLYEMCFSSTGKLGTDLSCSFSMFFFCLDRTVHALPFHLILYECFLHILLFTTVRWPQKSA